MGSWSCKATERFFQWKREHLWHEQGGAELLEFRDPNEPVSTTQFITDSLGVTVGFLNSPLKQGCGLSLS